MIFFLASDKVKGVMLLNQKVVINQFCHSEETLVFSQQRVPSFPFQSLYSHTHSQSLEELLLPLICRPVTMNAKNLTGFTALSRHSSNKVNSEVIELCQPSSFVEFSISFNSHCNCKVIKCVFLLAKHLTPKATLFKINKIVKSVLSEITGQKCEFKAL